VRYFLLLLVFTCVLYSDEDSKRRALFNSLDPSSISQHLAFYDLYGDSEEGKDALKTSWKLLTKKVSTDDNIRPEMPNIVQNLVDLINHPQKKSTLDVVYQEETLQCIESLAKNFPNRKLLGYHIANEADIEKLPEKELELTSAFLLTQFDEGPEKEKQMRLFEASLDLMALQILARLNDHATPLEKVRAINDLIFYELEFRFPPHSIYAKNVDTFTFLSSVLESRRGVCLGVSMLYLCLAERLGLALEIVTPPGHIYLRYNDNNKVRNIETTCRGVHLHSDEYLGINVIDLEIRRKKEVIGMAFFNQASVWLNQSEWNKAKIAYEKTLKYMPSDLEANLLYAATLYLTDRPKDAKKWLLRCKDLVDKHVITQDELHQDLFSDSMDKEALASLFSFVDDTHDSIIRKKEALAKAIEKNPQFRSGLFQLAICWLQLSRMKEGIEVFEKLHTLDPDNIEVNYYLSALYFERWNIPLSYKYLLFAKKSAQAKNVMPKPLLELEVALRKISPPLHNVIF